MALHLSVPAQEDRPPVHAETRPKIVRGTLALVPVEQPAVAAPALQQPLALLNRQAVRSELRLELMELYRPLALRVARELATQYRNHALPLPADAEAAAAAARALLTELAYGYKLAILDRMSRVFSLRGEKALALMVQRAMHALDQLLLVAYYTYTPAPDGVWSEIHRLYLHAVQHEVQDAEVAEHDARSSISLGYKRALLLALSNPQRLIAADLDNVCDYVARFGHLARLQPYGTPENPAGVFLVSLNSDQPAVPFDKHRGAVDLRADILLITVELARQINTHLTGLQKSAQGERLDLPESARTQHYQDLLRYLMKQWALVPQRTFTRLPGNESINVCVGLAGIHSLLDGGAILSATGNDGEEAAPSLNFTGIPDAGDSVHHNIPERWLVVNESAGGMALAKFPGAASALRVGELLGLRGDRGRQWGLGVVRRANSGNVDDLEVGVQMLAPSARAVAAQLDKNGALQPALLLPELPPLKLPATLLTACGVYRPARMLEVTLETNGKPVRMLATRLVERTGSFERFQFSLL